MGKFITQLEMKQIQEATPSRKAVYELTNDLIYYSYTLKCLIHVPKGFKTDLASVPRWLIFAYSLFGNLGNAAAVLHDFLYSLPHAPSLDSCKKISRSMQILGIS